MAVELDPPFDPSTIQTNAKLASALAPSLAIFPCGEAKTPVYGVPWKSARPGQIDRVQKWWSDHPDAMPGIHMGAVGLIGIDADGAEGVSAFEAICEPHGGVPECPMVDTPSGGRHYYFRQRPGEALGNGRGSLPPKSECPVDVRGDGGYLIAPDATREDGVYAIPDGNPLDILQAPELPEWLYDILSSKEAAVKAEEIASEPAPPQASGVAAPPKEISHQPGRALDMQHPRLRAWVEKAFDDEIQALAQSGRGGRNNQLNTSAFAIFQLVAAGWVAEDTAHTALVQAAEVCGLVKDDGRRGVLKTISSARRGGMAKPREVPEEFIRDEEIAASAVALNRDLAVSADGTLHDAATGEVIEIDAGDDLEEFPDHLTRNIPGLVGKLVDWIEATSIYPSRMMALGAALTLVGTCMGRTWCGPVKENGTALYVLAIAPSGAGKDHSLQAIRTILKLARLPRLIGADEFTGGPAINSMIINCPVRLCAMDEFGAFMARLTNKRSGGFETQATKILRTLWGTNSGEFVTTHKAQSDGTSIAGVHVSIYGTSTPGEFFEALSGKDVTNGFLNRFLFLASSRRPPDQKPLASIRDTPLEITDALYQIFGRGHDATQGELMNPSVDPSPIKIDWQDHVAEAAYDAFKQEVDRRSIVTDERGREKETEMYPYLRRTAEMALRMALIRAMGRNKLKPSVSVEDYLWASEVALWSAYAMAKACGLYISESASQADTLRIVRIVRELGGKCTRAQVNRKLRGILRKRDLDDTWKMLLEAGMLIDVGEEKATNGHVTHWFVLQN